MPGGRTSHIRSLTVTTPVGTNAVMLAVGGFEMYASKTVNNAIPHSSCQIGQA